MFMTTTTATVFAEKLFFWLKLCTVMVTYLFCLDVKQVMHEARRLGPLERVQLLIIRN